ncbi:septal ring lytic transglycosylase RlpA family protein [Haloferula rosea]|uniref:Probable endolytic peptidoglycan transglycosylase RlpA n=1 Tax=Haloferula rosea TaxID=490093 RepID=A0A934RBK6_9BACT|nr:septal ring lytic transglycosylase RlpA family protein [Haloferula rosea]MBK1826602.1 septal ring lytic transglycosylase RlpA family protein [Haloferula rosea]
MKRTTIPQLLAFVIALSLSSCASFGNNTDKKTAEKSEWNIRSIHHGKASWYGIRCNGGTHTASGETLCNHAPTAAHKTLPMGTKVRVTNLNNGKSEVVRINDRGPYIHGRIIDVTEGVAKRLDFYKRGIVRVKVEVLEKNSEDEEEVS